MHELYIPGEQIKNGILKVVYEQCLKITSYDLRYVIWEIIKVPKFINHFYLLILQSNKFNKKYLKL